MPFITEACYISNLVAETAVVIFFYFKNSIKFNS